jgi:hypothetical protein
LIYLFYLFIIYLFRYCYFWIYRFAITHCENGGQISPIMDHLVCFIGGTLASDGIPEHLELAKEVLIVIGGIGKSHDSNSMKIFVLLFV